MLNEKSLNELKLTEEQLQMYKSLEKKESALRNTLHKCGVHQNVVEKIIGKSDLNKIDLNNLEALEESVRQEWSDFIIERR